MNIQPENFYRKNLEFYQYYSKKLRTKSSLIAFLRLFSFILFVFFLIQGIKTSDLLLYAVFISTLILFFVLVSYSGNLSTAKKKAARLITINKNELKALKGEHSQFDDGKEFLEPDHEFTYDLDIFGTNSIFQYINRTCTIEGKRKLADFLLNSPFQSDEIKDLQEIYKELALKPKFIQDYLSTGYLTQDKKNDRKELIDWAGSERPGFSKFLKILTYFIPVVSILVIIAGIFDSIWFNALYITLPAVWFIYGLNFRRINNYHDLISRKQEILAKYLALSRIILKQEFFRLKLKNIHKTVKGSVASVKNLDLLVNLFDARLNMLVGVILNSIFMFDFHMINKLENWKQHNRELLTGFLDAPTEMDAFLSFTVYHFNNSEFVFPELSESALSAARIGHPLIHKEKRVNNDFFVNASEKVFIVTGANMAGKSTFLRTLGVNMILAGTGAPVCAKNMKFSPFKVYTGMRTTDNLAESESYFFAELKRLKKIVEKNKHGEKLFILLDEILKGTNSRDKHKGSVGLIRQLVNTHSVTVIATHDLKLGDLEKEYKGIVQNYCFESYIEGKDLWFDYKLKPGIAQNMNASFLMKDMGIIDETV